MKKFFLIFSIFYFLFSPLAYAASDFTVTPMVIDGKGKDREILRYSFTVTNTTKHLVAIYPWVTDVDTAKGSIGTTDLDGGAGKELGESLARWMEVTRGSVDLLPGEKKDIPVMVQINLNAKPGMYHAAIHLSPGGDRAVAEANIVGTEDIMVNIEVLEDINERLQLDTFMSAKNIFTGDSASFHYQLQNIGNRGLIPHGKLRIYDTRGQEVATVDANGDGKKLEPSANEMLSSVWAAGGHFGRYKAMLDLEYGNRGTLQDTVFFWVIPWQKVLGMFLSLMLICVIMAIVLHSYAQSRRQGFEPRTPTGRGLRAAFSRITKNDEEEFTVVDEMREVAIPRPVHTRLHARTADTPLATRLNEQAADVSMAHQVRLPKRESSKPDPHHVVNLRK